MSVRAIAWVFNQDIRPATRKLIMIAIADCVNDDDGMAFPSLATIEKKTSLNEKTVQDGLLELVDTGWLEDTKKRVGKTGQVKVYRMNGLPTGFIHYTFALSNAKTGEYFIGIRTTYGLQPDQDANYIGSGAWPFKMRREKVELVKVVLGTFRTRQEAEADEAARVSRALGDPLCQNENTPEIKGVQTPPFLPTNTPVFTPQTPPKTGDGTISNHQYKPSKVVELWNAMADRAGLVKVRALSAGRAKHLSARLAEPFFVDNLESGIAKIPGSSFLIGKNDRRWKADFDWLLRPDSMARLMEGKYDDKIAAARPPVDPEILKVGGLIFTRDRGPKREQFQTDDQYESYHMAWSNWKAGVK